MRRQAGQRSRCPAAPTRPQHGVRLVESHSDAARKPILCCLRSPRARRCRWPKRPAPGLQAGALFLYVNSASPAPRSVPRAIGQRGGGALRRRRSDDVTAASPDQGPPAAGWPPTPLRCNRNCRRSVFLRSSPDERLGVASATKMWPQHRDQGHGGDADRELHHRAPLWGRRRADRFIARNLPWGSTGKKARRLLLPARDRAWSAPQRRGSRSGGHCWRSRPRAVQRRGTAERQAWVADLADAGVFGNHKEPAFARSPDWRTEADRILQARGAFAPSRKD
jgi:hypothetical protein